MTLLCVDKLQILTEWEAAGLVHGDLKPSNICVDEADNVFLLDVESVVQLDKSRYYTEVPDGFRSTRAYRAPELDKDGVVCCKSDWFAVGKTLEELASVSYWAVRPQYAARDWHRICAAADTS